MGVATLAAVVVIAVFAFAQTPSDAADGSQSGGQTTGSIAADTSGSYAELVQRANGIYDKGAQAFQDNDQEAGAQHFAAAAKVYRAAWKQQATDPNVGTDYATSLFYSGDTDGALKQVKVVLAKSPDFQTAHLNKGVYLETAAQTPGTAVRPTRRIPCWRRPRRRMRRRCPSTPARAPAPRRPSR